jgi:hypothetical protein
VVGLSLILAVISRLSVEFSEFWAANVYPFFITTFGRFFGLFPFSVSEILLYLMIFGLIIGIIVAIRKKAFLKAGLWAACITSTLILIYIMNCSIMYNRHTFLHEFDVSFYRHDGDEEKVFAMILQEFIEQDLISQISYDENGLFTMTGNINKIVPEAMRNLAKTFERLDLHYPRPKGLNRLTSEIMTMGLTTGVFSPFTIEGNYNSIAPDSEKIFSAMHEMAHVAGFMREDEANFIAFMAGKHSSDPEAKYAAYLYAFNRFRQVDGFEDVVPEQVRRDLQAQYKFWWSRFYDPVYDEEGQVVDFVPNPTMEVVSTVTQGVNDAYLKSQGQSDGTLSYGRAADLIMAWYLR